MIRHLITPVAVIAAAALTAGLVHVAAPAKQQESAQSGAFCASALEAAADLVLNPERVPAAMHRAALNTLSAVAPGIAPRDPARTATMLLNQPVAVLERGRGVWTQLPEGTSVQIVGNQGRFVQVRHAEQVITIPRTALQAGVVKTF